MRFLAKILCILTASLAALSVSAQSVPTIPADTTAVKEEFVMPKDAPYLSEAEDRAYHIRRVNIHGVQHINHDIIRSSSGLVPGDSIYLSGSFIQNAMMRLWSQRYFEDIQIGATIEGDSVDLEVMLRERPRVMNWAVTGIPKG
jgi:outer membrane protein insertion porin family